MEVSNPIQADILHIQEQLKSALHDHQDLVLQQKLDSENAEIQSQLCELQNYIMFLGASQKQLLHDLRTKLDGGSKASEPSKVIKKTSCSSPESKRARLISSSRCETDQDPPISSRSPKSSQEPPASPKSSQEPPASPKSSQELTTSSPRSSPPPQTIRPSPSTRSSRLLASRSPSPPCKPLPYYISDDLIQEELMAALSVEATPQERKYYFLSCLELVSLERAAEMHGLINSTRLSVSPMDPFIMLSGLDPSQKRRRETYLMSGSPRKSQDSDDSSPERDSRSPSIPRRNSDSSQQGSDAGSEQDQLFTEHLLDTLLAHEHRAFDLMEEEEEECSQGNSQELESERDRLVDVQCQLSDEKSALEEKKEMLAHAIQEQDKKKSDLLESEAQTRRSIEKVHKFIAFFQQDSSIKPS